MLVSKTRSNKPNPIRSMGQPNFSCLRLGLGIIYSPNIFHNSQLHHQTTLIIQANNLVSPINGKNPSVTQYTHHHFDVFR